MLQTTRTGAWPALLATVACFTAPAVFAQGREEARLITATEVMSELRQSRDEAIPQWLLDRAYGVVVVPDVVKVSFWLGGRHGKGVMVVRDEAGRFSNPVFVNLSGGSFGPQIGAQSTDVVLVFTTRKGVEGITDGKVTLGADASVAAGPSGAPPRRQRTPRSRRRSTRTPAARACSSASRSTAARSPSTTSRTRASMAGKSARATS